jgi:3',5'-cyclic AMP phosphodiesterase CpdA
MKKYVVILMLILAILLPFFALKDCEKAAEPDCLSFRSEYFRIVQFTDFHEWMAQEGEHSSAVFELRGTLKPDLEEYIDTVLDIYRPDLAVLTGDNIFPLSFLYDLTYKVGANTYKRIGQIFEEREQYWTLTFGNHDSECVADKEDLLEAVKDNKYFVGGSGNITEYRSFTYSGTDDNGVMDIRLANFSIPIYGNGNSIAYNIYLFDSGSYNYVPDASIPYRYILDEQADWYKNVSSALKEGNGGNSVPSVAFTHIPLFEHEEAYLQGGEHIGVWTGSSPSDTRSRIFEDMLTQGDVRAIFTGHNHSNSITCFYRRDDKKIMMGITPQAAASGYESNDSTMRCRIIDLGKNGELSTFIDTSDPFYENRMEYGQTLTY